MAYSTVVQAALSKIGVSSVEDIGLNALLDKLEECFSANMQNFIIHTTFSWLHARLEAVHIDRNDIFVAEVAGWAQMMKDHGFSADQVGEDLEGWTKLQAAIDPTCIRKLEYLGLEIRKQMSRAAAVDGDVSPRSRSGTSDEGMDQVEDEANGDAKSDFPSFLTGANMPLEKIERQHPEGFLKDAKKTWKPKGKIRPCRLLSKSSKSQAFTPPPQEFPPPPADYLCHNCGIPGHWKMQCPKFAVPRDYVCLHCGRGGHWSSHCAQKRNASMAKTGSKSDRVDRQHQRYRHDDRKGEKRGSREFYNYRDLSSARQYWEEDPLRLKGPFEDDFDADDEGHKRKESDKRSKPRKIALDVRRDAKVEGRLSFHQAVKWEEKTCPAVESKRRNSPGCGYEASPPSIGHRTEKRHNSENGSATSTEGQKFVVVSDDEQDDPVSRGAKRQRLSASDSDMTNQLSGVKSCPATPAREPSPPIELGFAIKPFSDGNLIIRNLFRHRPNVWVQRVKRRTALDMWDACETSYKAETSEKEQDVVTSIMLELELDDKTSFHPYPNDGMELADETNGTRDKESDKSPIDQTQDDVVYLTRSDAQGEDEQGWYFTLSEFDDGSMQVDG